jgi:hypothetical protein
MPNKRLLKVNFAHQNEIRGVPSGNRYFDVLHIGYKWVRLRLSAKPHKNAHKISIVTWNKIIKRKDFVILEDNR